MAGVPIEIQPGATSGWQTVGSAVMFLYGEGTALVEYSTVGGEPKQWVVSEPNVAMGRAYPLDTPSGGCFVRVTNQSDKPAAVAFVEDLRR